VSYCSIKVKNLSKSYGLKKVLGDISFEVELGGSLVFLGPSGCGKTTILHILQGLITPDNGIIDFFPKSAVKSLVMQDHGLFPWKSAYKNLELPLQMGRVARPQRKEKVEFMLSKLGLSPFGKYYPSELSGGQKQRLALGRSLISEPKLLFLDEPFSSLDELSREDAEKLLIDIWKSLSVSMVISTHSVEEALLLGDRILVLGGSPTTVVGVFENPFAGIYDAKDKEGLFHLSQSVHSALRANIHN
jgi:NitT/TauT family transport system ATP-binding protein